MLPAYCGREATAFGQDQQVAPALLAAACSPLLVLADFQAQPRRTARVLRTKPQSLGRTVQWRDQLQRLEAEMEEQSRLQEVCSSQGS